MLKELNKTQGDLETNTKDTSANFAATFELKHDTKHVITSI